MLHSQPSPIHISCKAILFDMDGILISSLGAVERCWHKYAEMRGLNPAHALKVAHGCRAIETVARLCPDLDPVAELKVIEDLEVADTDGLAVLPGVRQFLAQLPEDRWAVVTSATRRLALARLAAAGLPMPRYLVPADHVTQGKPHPEPYLAGAAMLGFAPQDCVVFEDAPSGVRSGKAAGCTVVATTFSHSAEELASDHLLPHLVGLKVMLLPGQEGLRIDIPRLTS